MNHKLIIFLGLMFISMITFAQTKNSATEVKDYREVDGKIILDVIVNGEVAPFVLDLAGHTAILPEYVENSILTRMWQVVYPIPIFCTNRWRQLASCPLIRSLLETTCSVMVFQLSF